MTTKKGRPKSIDAQRVRNLAKKHGVSIATIYRRLTKVPIDRVEMYPEVLERKTRSDVGKGHRGGFLQYKPWKVHVSARELRRIFQEKFGDVWGMDTSALIKETIYNAELESAGWLKRGNAAFFIELNYSMSGFDIPTTCPLEFLPYKEESNAPN